MLVTYCELLNLLWGIIECFLPNCLILIPIGNKINKCTSITSREVLNTCNVRATPLSLFNNRDNVHELWTVVGERRILILIIEIPACLFSSSSCRPAFGLKVFASYSGIPDTQGETCWVYSVFWCIIECCLQTDTCNEYVALRSITSQRTTNIRSVFYDWIILLLY